MYAEVEFQILDQSLEPGQGADLFKSNIHQKAYELVSVKIMMKKIEHF